MGGERSKVWTEIETFSSFFLIKHRPTKKKKVKEKKKVEEEEEEGLETYRISFFSHFTTDSYVLPSLTFHFGFFVAPWQFLGSGSKNSDRRATEDRCIHISHIGQRNWDSTLEVVEAAFCTVGTVGINRSGADLILKFV